MQLRDNAVFTSDGSDVFQELDNDLGKVNNAKGAVKKSLFRYNASTNIQEDGTRKGPQGNTIKYTPLPIDFNPHKLMAVKHGRRWELPGWTEGDYHHQFTLLEDQPNGVRPNANADAAANPGNVPPPPPILPRNGNSTFYAAYCSDGQGNNRNVFRPVASANNQAEDAAPLEDILSIDGSKGCKCSLFCRSILFTINVLTKRLLYSTASSPEDNGMVPFGQRMAVLRQNEMYEGELIHFTLQLQIDPHCLVGTTGFPFYVKSELTTLGATDNLDVEHNLFTVLFPVQNVGVMPVVTNRDVYPRFSKSLDSIIFAIRGKFTIMIITIQSSTLLFLPRFSNVQMTPTVLSSMICSLTCSISCLLGSVPPETASIQALN